MISRLYSFASVPFNSSVALPSILYETVSPCLVPLNVAKTCSFPLYTRFADGVTVTSVISGKSSSEREIILNDCEVVAPYVFSHFPRFDATTFTSIGNFAFSGILSRKISIFQEYEPSSPTILTAFAGPYSTKTSVYFCKSLSVDVYSMSNDGFSVIPYIFISLILLSVSVCSVPLFTYGIFICELVALNDEVTKPFSSLTSGDLINP